MITKVDVQKFGQFSDFEWNTCCNRDLHFKKLNILYGRNYSGKTTLSRLFRWIEKNTLHENYCDAGFNFLLDDNSIIRYDNLSSSRNNLKVRVYNSDFVKENLSWLHNVDGTIEPFAILGEQNVNLNQQISQIETSLGNIENKTGLLWEMECLKEKAMNANEEYEKSKNDLDAKLRAKAVEIKNEGQIFNVSTYNINSIKADITVENISKILDAESTVEKKKSLTELSKSAINPLREQQPHLNNYINVVGELIQTQIKISQPIADLLSDTLLQQWVWEGIDKHKGKRNTCGFCGHVITNNLWSLDNHFNTESQTLMNRNSQFRGVSHYVTNFGLTYEVYTLAAFGVGGWVFNRPKMNYYFTCNTILFSSRSSTGIN
jgi:hypothetical protein